MSSLASIQISSDQAKVLAFCAGASVVSFWIFLDTVIGLGTPYISFEITGAYSLGSIWPFVERDLILLPFQLLLAGFLGSVLQPLGLVKWGVMGLAIIEGLSLIFLMAQQGYYSLVAQRDYTSGDLQSLANRDAVLTTQAHAWELETIIITAISSIVFILLIACAFGIGSWLRAKRS